MKVVIDEGVPRQLVEALNQRGISASRFPVGSAGMKNGDLIRDLDNLGFDVLVTNDKNIANQQSLRDRRLAVVALPHNRRRAILERIDDIVDTLQRVRPSQHVVIGWDGSRSVTQVVAGQDIAKMMPAVPPFEV